MTKIPHTTLTLFMVVLLFSVGDFQKSEFCMVVMYSAITPNTKYVLVPTTTETHKVRCTYFGGESLPLNRHSPLANTNMVRYLATCNFTWGHSKQSQKVQRASKYAHMS